MTFGQPSRSELRGYLLAISLVGGMVLLKIGLAQFDYSAAPFTAMSLPVLISAWIGGWGPGLVATGLSWLAARWLIANSVEQVGALDGIVFILEGVLISWLADRLRSERTSGVLSRQQLRMFHEGVDDCALLILDNTGRVVDWNAQAAAITGYEAADIVGHHFAETYVPEDREAGVPEKDLQEARQNNRIETIGWRVRKDGSKYWAETQLTALRDDDRGLKGFAHLINDLSERKRTEQELQDYRTRLEELVAERTLELHDSMNRLRLSERMAALGTLSAGLGHDMGNLLLPIRLRLDAMQSRGVPDSMREDLSAIATCADYLQRLSNGLRLLSIDPSQANATPPTTDLADWWSDVQPFLRNALPKRIELERRLPPDLPSVAVQRHLLTQAVFNLVQNSGHAISSSNSPGFVRIWAERGEDDHTVRIGVTDNGQGMSEEVRARCLEPFYTSKTRAISTGLGLTLVHGVVQQAGGRMEIESTEGVGTTFVLILPSADRSQQNNANTPRTMHAVVDVPDSRVRTYMGAMLRSAGFEASYGRPVDDPDAQLFISHASVVDPNELAAFLDGGSCPRRCVILGRRPDSAFPTNVVFMDEQPPPATVRETLRNIAHDLRTEINQESHA